MNTQQKLKSIKKIDAQLNRKRGNFEPTPQGYISPTGELVKVKKDGLGYSQDRGEMILVISLGCLSLAILVAGVALSLYHL